MAAPLVDTNCPAAFRLECRLVFGDFCCLLIAGILPIPKPDHYDKQHQEERVDGLLRFGVLLTIAYK